VPAVQEFEQQLWFEVHVAPVAPQVPSYAHVPSTQRREQHSVSTEHGWPVW
jgi:hypothetical protein